MSSGAAVGVFVVGAAALAAAAWYASNNADSADNADAGGWAFPDLSGGLGGAIEAADDFANSIIAEAAPLVYSFIDVAGGAPSGAEFSQMSNEQNVAAFLRMVRVCEVGTDGEAGYRTIYGGGLFDSYADHPRQAITRTMRVNGVPKAVSSTAAGAYQFLAGTWDDARRALGLSDFSPASQDAGAVWLLRRRGALADVRAGRFEAALKKSAREWASLPGSPYGQPMRTLEQVASLYLGGGGVIDAGTLA